MVSVTLDVRADLVYRGPYWPGEKPLSRPSTARNAASTFDTSGRPSKLSQTYNSRPVSRDYAQLAFFRHSPPERTTFFDKLIRVIRKDASAEQLHLIGFVRILVDKKQ
jgi:hypothetical protein